MLLKIAYPLVHIDPMWLGQLFVMLLCISVKPQRFATMQMNDGLCDMGFCDTQWVHDIFYPFEEKNIFLL